MKRLNKKPMLAALVWGALWLSISEVIRYFAYVMPVTRAQFDMIPDVAPMSLGVFGLWTIWMTLLTLVVLYAYWLHAKVMGHSVKTALLSASFSWVMFFLLFWLGNINMGLAEVSTAIVALPWAWVELVITCMIAKHFLNKSA